MHSNQRRLVRGIFLTVFILAVGLVVGFGSSYLGQFFSESFTSRSPNPEYPTIANINTNSDNLGMNEQQVTELLDQLSELIRRCDSILTQDGIEIFNEQKIEKLRSQLYLIYIDLNHLQLQNP